MLLSNEDASLTGQLVGLAAIFGFVFSASFLVWLILKVTTGIRVSEADEYEGVDLAECGMQAYPEFVGGHFAASDAPPAGGRKREVLASSVLAPSESAAT